MSLPPPPATAPMEVAFDAFMAETKQPTRTVDFVQTIIPADFMSPDNANHDNDDGGSTTAHMQQQQLQQGYTLEAVNAIRANDIAALQRMWAAGKSFHVCNANGEYLIHLACRRAAPATVEFLLHTAAVPATVRDRQGRTILHDICWKSVPDVAMMAVVLPAVPPELLLARDVRGHVPFDFARQHHAPQWNDFLQSHRDLIQERLFAHYFNKALLVAAEQPPQPQQASSSSSSSCARMEYSMD